MLLMFAYGVTELSYCYVCQAVLLFLCLAVKLLNIYEM